MALVITSQEAQKVPVGAFLDPSRKVRVHTTLTRAQTTILAYRVRGSKAPGTQSFPATQQVKTYAKI